MKTMTWKEYLEDLLENSTERTEQERLKKEIKEIEEKEKNKNKVYLVVNHWSNETTGEIEMVNYKVFGNYDKAKKYFNDIKTKIMKKIDIYGYDYIDDEEDNFYCASVEGEYLYYHDLVVLKEMELE